MVGALISFASGFVTGCLYTSYRFQKNPNDLIKMAGQDVQNAGQKITETAENIKDGVVNAVNDIKMNKQVNGVSAPEVVPAEEVAKL